MSKKLQKKEWQYKFVKIILDTPTDLLQYHYSIALPKQTKSH